MNAAQLVFVAFISQLLSTNSFQINDVTPASKNATVDRTISFTRSIYPSRNIFSNLSPNQDEISNFSITNENVFINTQNRVARDADSLFSICFVKELDLNDLLDIINGADLLPETIIRINQNKSSGERCKQLMQNIKEAALKLKNDVQQIQTSRIEEIKAQFEDEIKRLKIRMAQSEDSNRKTKGRLDAVISKYQQLQNNLNNALKIIGSVREEVSRQRVRLCAAFITSGQIDLAVEEFKKLSDTNEIYQITRYGYNSHIINFPKVMKFIELLENYNDLNQLSVAYTTLFNEMKRNGNINRPELFRLALKIKAILSKDIDLLGKRKFENIRNNFPAAVRAIVWGPACLKNKHFDEYIYPAIDDLAADNDRRRIFTWAEKGDKFHEGYWIFEQSTADSRYVRMKNIHFDEYFYAAYAKHNEDGREVYTWRPKGDPNGCVNEQCMWEITLYDETSVKLKNIQFNEYLCAADELRDKSRRLVFTWGPGAHDAQAIWKVEAC